MVTPNPHNPPGFREAFDSAREATVTALLTATAGAVHVACGSLNDYGMFGWQLEATQPQFADRMQGDITYGCCAYLKHMINQGFMVGFCVWVREKHALVCIKAWEPGEQEPAWPRSTEDATVVYHKPVSVQRDA